MGSKTVTFKFDLGEDVQDRVTGFEGIVMCRAEYTTGCRHYALCLRKVTKEGKPLEWEYFDESRLVSTGKDSDLSWIKPVGLDPSGPFSNPPQD